MSVSVPVINGISPIIDDYDGFILDLWGVLHDGTATYPGVVETLACLRAAGKRVLLLSNAPRRAEWLVAQMASMGIGPDLYGELLSSGEMIRQALARRDTPPFSLLGPRLHHMGPPHCEALFSGLPFEAADVDTADFILNSGPWGEETVEDFLPRLERGAVRRLPMLCANPDLTVVRQGRTMPCAGLLALRYEEMGGTVVRVGKPDPIIYGDAVSRLGTAPARTLVVGDGMATDIAGARAAGLASLLIAGGIHCSDLGIPLRPESLEQLFGRYGYRPTAVAAAFTW